MASGPRTRWGNLARSTRDRYARQARAQFGISRRSAREMYNRGTWRPAARNPEHRVPRDVLRNPSKYAGRNIPGVSISDLRSMALANWDRQLGDYFKFNRFTILENIDHASPETLSMIAGASENELTEWASYQDRKGAPQFVRASGWKDEKEQWHSVFWYH